nr:hypothetical protein [Tanacetum cinerariifolium]
VRYNKYNSRRMRISSVPKLVSVDITGGQEELPILVINTIDDTTITAKDVLFECGLNCGCGPGCINRVSQREIKYQLEVFRTFDRGWAVKTNDFIPSGAPICEYIGQLRRQCEMDKVDNNEYIFEINCEQTIKEIRGREVQDSGGRLIEAKMFCLIVVFRTSDRGWAVKTNDFIPSGAPICDYIGQLRRQCEMDKVDNNEYIFEIDCEQTIKEIGGRERRMGAVSAKSENLAVDKKESIPSEPEFCIEAGSVGNELTYDYRYAIDSVVDENGNVQKLSCHRGTSLCRERLY